MEIVMARTQLAPRKDLPTESHPNGGLALASVAVIAFQVNLFWMVAAAACVSLFLF